MRDGDIGNRELPRAWFVVEGFVLLEQKPGKHKAKRIRDEYVMNTYLYKRTWDLVWRMDVRVNLVTFVTDSAWITAVQEWLDEVDFPAPLYAYSFERFLDEIVTLPSTWAVVHADATRELTYGPKGILADPSEDFDLTQY